jgi:hypothetical protein
MKRFNNQKRFSKSITLRSSIFTIHHKVNGTEDEVQI